MSHAYPLPAWSSNRTLCAFVFGVGAAAAASWVAAPGTTGLMGAILATLMLTIALTDARTLIIPNALNACVAAAGFLDIAIQRRSDIGDAMAQAGFRAFLVVALLYAFAAIYHRLRGRQGLGLGDVKLAGSAAIWLDWRPLSISIEIAAFSALALTAIWRLQSATPVNKFTKLPLGAFFAPSIWLCWLAIQLGY